jgi:hypothetical protein
MEQFATTLALVGIVIVVASLLSGAVDVRAERSYAAADVQAAGAVRLPPDDAVRAAQRLRLPREPVLALYCA